MTILIIIKLELQIIKKKFNFLILSSYQLIIL
jgi:hypothetical protein